MTYTSELLSTIESHIAGVRREALSSGGLYVPMDYILGLGGKRIRPLLLLLSYHAYQGKDPSPALDAATAVELFHNFTLLHDDIMDCAPVRRGKPTVHVKWDTNTAILTGDAMFALSFGYLTKGFPAQAFALAQEFTRVSVGVCEGQMEDMELATRPAASIEDYIEMIRKKTAMLLGGCMSLGALAAGAHAEEAAAFYAYGEAAGIGFQLHDDYLDVFADKAKFGKQVGGDILENKKTFLLLRAYEKANGHGRQELERLIVGESDPARKVKGVTQLYVDLGIPGETMAKINHYFELASHLGKGLAKYPGFGHIEAFMAALMQRDH